MTDEQVLEKVRKFLANRPATEFSESSRKLLRDNPLEWVAAKARLVRAALLIDDQEGLALLKNDVAHVVGIAETEWWIQGIMEKMVAETYHGDYTKE